MSFTEPQPSTSKQAKLKAAPLTEQFFKDKKKRRGYVKHEIVRRYLGAWSAALSKYLTSDYRHIVYVDGFAGMGIYNETEYGSPTIAYKLLLEHSNLIGTGKTNPVQIRLIFVEKNRKSCRRLKQELIKLMEANKDSKNAPYIKFMIICGEFSKAMGWIISDDFNFPKDEEAFKLLHSVPQNFRPFQPNEQSTRTSINPKFITRATPLLVFADPFGYSGMPMSLMRLILVCSSKAELLVNIMTGSLVRFLKLDATAKRINEFFGSDDWKTKTKILESKNPIQKRKRLLEFYYKQVIALKANISEMKSLRFEMRDDSNLVIYYLFFVTQHAQGISKMKRGMRPSSQNDYYFKFSEKYAKKMDFRRNSASIEDLVAKIKEVFKDRQNVLGSEITKSLDNHDYLFQRYRNGLKRALKDYCISESHIKSFDKMVFDFTKKVEFQSEPKASTSGAATRGRNRKPTREETPTDRLKQKKMTDFFK